MDRAFLEGLELDKDKIDKVMAEHGKSIKAVQDASTKTENELNDKITKLEADLADANEKYKDYDELAGNKAKLEGDLNEANTKNEETEKQLAKLQKEVAIEREAVKQGAIDPLDIGKYIDADTIEKDDKGNFIGIGKAVETLKKEKAYLFDGVKKTSANHEQNPASSDNGALRKAMGLPVKN